MGARVWPNAKYPVVAKITVFMSARGRKTKERCKFEEGVFEQFCEKRRKGSEGSEGKGGREVRKVNRGEGGKNGGGARETIICHNYEK